MEDLVTQNKNIRWENEIVVILTFPKETVLKFETVIKKIRTTNNSYYKIVITLIRTHIIFLLM